MTKQHKSRAICILGMHRSGTSVLTRAINLLGVEVGTPENIMLPSEGNNPEGFWEHQEIVDVHDKILKMFSKRWDATSPLLHQWWQAQEIKPYKEKLKKIVVDQFLDKSLWCWKDPRTCILLPIWKEILDELGIELTYIIAVRNPLDVAASLKKRDNFSQDKALGMWALYTLSALFWSQNSERTIVHFDDLLENWAPSLRKICSELSIEWPSDEVKLKADMESFLKPNLRHSKSDMEILESNAGIPYPVITLYRLCLNLINQTDIHSSDKIEELYNNYVTYSRLITGQFERDQKMEVFWSDSDQFSQASSQSITIYNDDEFHEYQINIPKFTNIRIDPTNFPALIDISKIEIINPINGYSVRSWSSCNGFDDIVLYQHLLPIEQNGSMSLLAYDGDPGLVISNVHDDHISDQLRIHISMKINTKLNYYIYYLQDNHYRNKIRQFEDEMIANKIKFEDEMIANKIKIEEKDSLILVINNQLSEAQTAINESNRLIQHFQSELNLILQSKSWKLTAPLRWIMKLLR